MASSRRQISWRQGHALTDQAIAELSPGTASTDRRIVLVISHDCDLVHHPDREPRVEILGGRFVDHVDGNYTHAKNPRRLHIKILCEGQSRFVEFLAIDKHAVEKAALLVHEPSTEFQLEPASLATLQRWLAARYRRHAFPEEFDRRMGNAKIYDGLAKIAAKMGHRLIDILFDLDEGRDFERNGADDLYTLYIVLMYSTDEDPAAASSAAGAAAQEIKDLFDKKFFSCKNEWSNVELTGCDPIADSAMTVRDFYHLKRWNADYVSLGAEPQLGAPKD